MKKRLTEERMRKLAGVITEESAGDTVSLYKLRRDQKKRERHAAEKEFFGSARDPLITTDVPAEPEDPEATQALSAADAERLDKEVGDARLRPIAMDIYQRLVEPKYNEERLEFLVGVDDEVENLVNQLFGWFHPAAQDSRGRTVFDNPGRWAVQVAQEFDQDGKDLIDNAEEFNDRIEKLEFEAGREEFRKAKAHSDRHPARKVKVGRSAIPGTEEYQALQNIFKMIDAENERNRAPTGKMKK